MDPVSIVGLVGSIISIVDIVAKSISKLSDLRTKDHNAPLQVTTLIGQLYIIKAVIDELTRWKENNSTDDLRYHYLAMQVEKSLECFCPMILSLQQYLDNLEVFSLSNDATPDFQDRLSYLWNEGDISTYMALVDRQVNALNLLLQAVQCSTWAEQNDRIKRKESQDVLRLARDCTSSILGLADRVSIVSENTTGLSIQFDFDSIVLGSHVYQTAHRSHVKQIIRADRVTHQATTTNDTEAEEVHRLHVQQTTNADQVADPAAAASESQRKEEKPRALLGHTVYIEEILSLYKAPHRDKISVFDKWLSPALRDDNGKGGHAANIVVRPTFHSQPSSTLSADSKDTVRSRLRMGLPWASLRHTIRQRRIASASAEPVELMKSVEAIVNKRIPFPKVLLLGTSESGKSTVLKTLKLILEGDYTPEESESFKEIIFSNITQSTRVVLEAMESLEIPLDDEKNGYHVQTIFMQPTQPEDLPPEVYLAIKALWDDAGFLEGYRRRFEYQMNVSARDFARDAGRLASQTYMPSDKDILRSRVKTTGITETYFTIRNDPRRFYFYDVGGTRSERKKWIHAFEYVSSIIHTVDATAYAKALFEDETVNRMEEQLRLFDSIVNSRWFQGQTSILLVFTHVDQIDETMKISPVQEKFLDYAPDPQAVNSPRQQYLHYLEDRFRSLIKDEEKRKELRVIHADLINGDRRSLGDHIFEVIM